MEVLVEELVEETPMAIFFNIKIPLPKDGYIELRGVEVSALGKVTQAVIFVSEGIVGVSLLLAFQSKLITILLLFTYLHFINNIFLGGLLTPRTP